jgi:hypothetical protein
MVDRQARNRLIEAIIMCLESKVDDHAFEQMVTEIDTKDEVAFEFQLNLNNLTDFASSSLSEQRGIWQYFNRYMLLLHSDAEFEWRQGKLRWKPIQALPALCLVTVVLALCMRESGVHLPIVFLVFATVDALCRRFFERRDSGDEELLSPFDSYASLSIVRRNTPSFAKLKVPRNLDRVKISRDGATLITHMLWLPVYVLLAPILLVFSSLPFNERKQVVVLKSPSP